MCTQPCALHTAQFDATSTTIEVHLLSDKSELIPALYNYSRKFYLIYYLVILYDLNENSTFYVIMSTIMNLNSRFLWRVTIQGCKPFPQRHTYNIMNLDAVVVFVDFYLSPIRSLIPTCSATHTHKIYIFECKLKVSSLWRRPVFSFSCNTGLHNNENINNAIRTFSIWAYKFNTIHL